MTGIGRVLPFHTRGEGTVARGRSERLAVVVMVVVAGVFYAAMSWSNRAPQIFSDEAANLGNARWLVGGTLWRMGQASGASIGYSILIAPISGLIDSPELTYRLVILLNVVLAAGMSAVLYAVARRGLGAGHRTALVSAATASAYPAVAVQVGVAWVEIASMLAMSVFVLTLVCAAKRLTPTTVVGHGTIAGVLAGLHGRFAVIPILAVAALLLVGVLRPRVRWWAAGSALVAVALDVGLAHLAGLAQKARWTYVGLPDISLRQLLATSPASELRSLAGQGWYLIAGSIGLVLAGLAGLVTATRTRTNPGPDSRATDPSSGRSHHAELESEIAALVHPKAETGIGGRLLAMYALLAVGSIFLVSATYMAIYLQANPGIAREDLIYYGRYSESFVPALLCLAITILLIRKARRFVFLTLGSAVVLIPGLLGIASVLRGNLRFNGIINPYMTTALDPYFGLNKSSLVTDTDFTLRAIIYPAALTVIVLVLTLTRRILAPVVVVCVFLVIGFLDIRHLSAHTDQVAMQIPAYQKLEALSPGTVAYDPATVGVYLMYALPFWLYHSDFVSFDSTATKWPKADLFVGPAKWPLAAAHGLRRLTIDQVTGRGIYASAG